MWMHSQEMAEGGHVMGGMGGQMMIFGLLYVFVVIVFLWFMYRGVTALEEIAESKKQGDELEQ